jgi:hypothetical protein
MDFFHVELDGEFLAGMVDVFAGNPGDEVASAGLEIDDGLRVGLCSRFLFLEFSSLSRSPKLSLSCFYFFCRPAWMTALFAAAWLAFNA